MGVVNLDGIVRLAKMITAGDYIFVPGMVINYALEYSVFDQLQKEVHIHNYGHLINYKPVKVFEFELMEIEFKFSMAI